MRKFKYEDPDEYGNVVEHIITEDEILNIYYDYWCKRMKEIGKENQISKERCIEDFVIVHWAWEIKDEILQ